MAEEEGVEIGAKTVDEAINAGLEDLGLTRNQVRIEVLAAGSPGLLGLGGEDARVRLTPLPEGQVGTEEETLPTEEEAAAESTEDTVSVDEDIPASVETAMECLHELLTLLDIKAEVSARPPETAVDGVGRASMVLDVTGDDLGLLIGRRGSTLAALQYLVNLITNRKSGEDLFVNVDVERYKRRREESLQGLALRMADRVQQTGRMMTLEPMPAAERRIVHLALADNPEISTTSVGDGESRKVSIFPKRRPPPPLPQRRY